jgi:calcium binding protein 39
MTSFLNSIGKRKKSPEQLVLSAKQAVQSIIDASVKEEDRVSAVDTLGKSLLDIKNILCGTVENVEVDEEKVLEVSKCIQQEGLVGILIIQLDSATLEGRKDVVTIFNHMLKKNINNFVEYLVENSTILESLLVGYKSDESALHCGAMTRECLRYESLARHLLSSEQFWEFFTSYVHIANFEIASDAFNTLKDLLTMPKQRHVAQEFMERNCDKLLEKYDVSGRQFCRFFRNLCASLYLFIFVLCVVH